MIIHCTKKLSTKLQSAGLEVRTESLGPDSALGAWHANITTIQRRQCLIFCHDQTRFTLAMLGVTAKELKQLDHHFYDLLVNTLLKAGTEPELIEAATKHFSPLRFDTTCDRSVQGTLRQMAFYLESMAESGTKVMDLPLYSTSVHLSDTPCSIKGMKASEMLWPIKAMAKRLASLKGGADARV